MYVNPKYQKQSEQPKQNNLNPDVQAVAVPAPTGGWNAIMPLNAMPPSDAVVLTNFVPRPGYVELRGGYNAWSQGLSTGAVESILVYRPANGSEKMFAAAGSKIYDCSSYGVVVDQGFSTSNNRFQHINITPAGGFSYLVVANGADQLRNYNGSVWDTPVITGFNSALAIGLHVHMRRIWMVEKNSTRVWYLGTDAIAGAATAFELGSFWNKGSYLVAMTTWTVDGSNGPEALAVFISNKGQVSIFLGTDPTNATTFVSKGTFDLAPPIGRRCFTKFGSDVCVITLEGVLPLSKALPVNTGGDRAIALTNKIQSAMLSAAQNAPNLFGWEVTLFPQQSLMLVNVPIAENSSQQQFVMNTIATDGPWTLFTGWNANCFEIYNESLYFGDNTGSVNLAYTGGADLISPIYYDSKSAFNFFQDPGRLKVMSMIRPYIVSSGSTTPTLSVNVDFQDTSITASVSVLQPSGGVWDTAIWDGSSWSGGLSTNISWLSVGAIGTTFAIRITVNLTQSDSSSASLTSLFDLGLFDSVVFDGNGSITSSGRDIPVLQLNAFEVLLENGGTV